MEFLIVSFMAGVLTAVAPCIFPLLPVIVGGSVLESGSKKQWWRPLLITGSLALSVILFTLLLKASTSLLNVPQVVWNIISGSIVVLLGLTNLFPHAWEVISVKTGLQLKSSQLMQKSSTKKSGFLKDILMGVSLGPVFSSCSPTYALIVAVVLPKSFLQGFVYLIYYALGLAVILLVIAFAGQSIIKKLGWLSSPSGWFRKVLGVLFIIVGLAVMTGLDKDFQAFVIGQGWYDPITKIEQRLN